MNERPRTRRSFARTRPARGIEMAEQVLRIEMPTWVACPDRISGPRVERLVLDQPVRPIFF